MTIDEARKLAKPCPFCGERPEVDFFEYGGDARVYCCNGDHDAMSMSDGTDFSEAVEKWNRRASDDG